MPTARSRGRTVVPCPCRSRSRARSRVRPLVPVASLYSSAAGIIAYFALSNEPQPRVAAALCWRNRDLPRAPQCAARACSCRGVSHLRERLCHGQASYEITRAPVLAHELRYVGVSGWVETHELRDKGRARLSHQGPLLGRSRAGGTPYRVRVTMPRPMPPIAASARQWRSALRFNPLRNR
jgi:hypothetical protein